MSYNPYKTQVKESKGVKRLRIFIAAMYFIQVILTTFPFMRGLDDKGALRELTVFGWIIQPGNFQTVEGVKLTLVFGVLLVFPMVCFFFYCLNKTNLKNYVSVLCCVTCACLITFGIGPNFLATGSLFALLLYIFILFLSTVLMLKIVADKHTK